MRAPVWRGLAVCAAIPIAVMMLGPAAHAEEPVSEAPATTLTERIVEAAEAGATAPSELAAEVSLPADGGGSLTFDAAERIVATVVFAQAPTDADRAALAALAEIDTDLAPFPAFTVRVDPAQLGTLGELPGVLSATPALSPFTGTDVRAEGPRAATDAPVAPCGPIPIEADSPLRSAEARAQFGVDGTGVTVGVISDSFAQTAAPTSWQDDVASGALPGPGNPCGRETPVEVLFDGTSGASDEGRGMAQLVHGIAPGARILFADAGRSDMEMANHIVALQEAGADIIVDDISWTQETLYQQGFISSAIEEVKSRGVAYFTSAGNSNAVGSVGASAGRPISSWSTAAYRPTECPAWVVTDDEDDPLYGATGFDCLDFDPSDAVATPYDTLHTLGEPGGNDITVQPIGSIGEPLFGVTTQYEWRYFAVDPATQEPELVGVVPQIGAEFPGVSGQVAVPRGAEIRMVMVRTAHDPAAPLPAVTISFMRGGPAFTDRAHLGDGVTDIVGPSTFGHSADGSGLSTASLHWDAPETVRDYSSLGSATLRFEPVNLQAPTPSAALPSPVRVQSPHIAAVDGTQTTFFGEDEGDGEQPEYRFYGTSAAAPNAAAVAALGKSYAPSVGGAELSALIQATARGTAEGGPVNPYLAAGHSDADVFGAGIVDAMGLLEALPAAPVGPAAPTGLRATDVTASGFAVGWDPVAGAASLRVDLLPGAAEQAAGAAGAATPSADQAPAPLASVELPADATGHRFTELAADTAYLVRVTAVGAEGQTAASTLPVRTIAAEVTPKPKPEPVVPTTPEPQQQARGPLAQTGGGSALPIIIAGGALLLVGAATIAVVAARRRSALALGDAPGPDAVRREAGE
ncbi:S8 family serine peptidase [Leucobacter chromiireducens]|uniref:Fibronectin type-III domain-containing protein n=1 Tax=Leucobacter chromiireducens subsp. solipictus TaxID=398235 RepID=A0ABS1SHV7_9MICO|nr:S8 family serine peptidase [Leucobacter chromiireducens]MBL3679622.1 hypothetical protein [Leucobacter chromiireducens subsp. solipictus]